MSNADPTPEKPVEEWVTGDEPMTGPQRSYLQTLAREAGENLPENLTKAEASQLIDRLQRVTGRGDSDRAGGTGNDSDSHPSVDELTEQGIVDQQAAAEVPAVGSSTDDDLPPGHPAGKNPAVSSGELLSDHRVSPAGAVGSIDLDDPDSPVPHNDASS